MPQAVVFCCNNIPPVPGIGDHTPLCLLPVGARPVMAHILQRLAGFGLRNVLVILPAGAQETRNAIAALPEANGRRAPDAKLAFFHEHDFTGICETLFHARDMLERDFLVLPQPVLPGADLPGLMREHAEKRSHLTWLTSMHSSRDTGAKQEECVALCMSRSLLDEEPPPNVYCGQELVVQVRQRASAHMNFRAAPFPSMARNHVVEDLHTLWRANMAALDGQLPFLRLPPPYAARPDEPGLRIATPVAVAGDARLIPPVIMGEGCVVESRATIGPYAVIGARSAVKAGATVTSSVVLDHGYVGRNVMIHSALLGNGFYVRHPEGDVVKAPECSPPAARLPSV